MTRKRKRDSANLHEGNQTDPTSENNKKIKTYEIIPRQAQWKDETIDEEQFRYRLPIKTKTGWIAQEPVPIEHSQEEEEDKEEQVVTDRKEEEEDTDEMPSDDDLKDLEEDESQDKEKVSQVRSTVQLLARRTAKINKKKHIIADYSSRILEDPQNNVHLLNKLYRYCLDRCSDVALTIRKLSMMSLVTVYKDIIPGYRIRDLTDAERAVKVSKDVRQLRDFEQKLLKFYDKFITVLQQTVQAGLSEKKKKGTPTANDVTLLDTGLSISSTGLENLGLVALKCMCELGTWASHFNYREKIFPVLVNGLISTRLNGLVATLSCDAVSKIFQNDIIGEISLEIVQLISKLTKARNYYTKPQILQPLVHLNLQHVNQPVSQLGSSSSGETSRQVTQRKKKIERQCLNRKQKRKENTRLRLEKELRETEAEERIEKKEKLQTEIIKLVFLIYFRVLKHAQDSPLLGVVLEGLAKFAHLISVDYFADLMTVLHSLMERNLLSSQQTMQCIVTAFQILSGQGEALNIDPRQFFCQLYTHLLDLDHRTNEYNMTLILNCLDKVVRQKRKISSDRVLGIVKRIATMSLQLSPPYTLGLMHSLRQFIQTYRVYSERLLDNEEVCSSGVFRPDVTDPEMSCASSTHLWELATLRHHFDPHITCYAEHLIKGAPSQGTGSLHPNFSRKNSVEIMESHSWQLVDPFITISPLPLSKRKRKSLKREFTAEEV